MIEEAWGDDLVVVQRQFTLVGVNPALDQFTDLAEEIKTAAEQLASVCTGSFAPELVHHCAINLHE